jgi:hypothetical protein
MIFRIAISTFLILAMYALGWTTSLILWNHRHPTGPVLQRTSPHRVELAMTPDRSIFQAGDRVDILADLAEGSKIIVLDAVVLGTSPASLWLGIQREDDALVRENILNLTVLKIQRTISLEVTSTDPESFPQDARE